MRRPTMSTSRHDATTTRLCASHLPDSLETSVRRLGFWTAVLMPFVLLGLIVAGLAQQSPLLLGSLLAANVTGLVIGKEYKRMDAVGVSSRQSASCNPPT